MGNTRIVIKGFMIFTALSLGFFQGEAFAAVEHENLEFPQKKTYQGTSYMTGGVSIGEREEIKNMAHEYTLKLVFSWDKGNYLAATDVEIKDSKGQKVLEATTRGPWLYADLPPGKYTIEATEAEEMKQKSVQVQAQQLSVVYFSWKKE